MDIILVGDKVRVINPRHPMMNEECEVVDYEVDSDHNFMGYIIQNDVGTQWLVDAYDVELLPPPIPLELETKEDKQMTFFNFDEEPTCPHKNVVRSHAGGEFFNYCRDCKKEV